MASKGSYVAGTDGSDYAFRQRVVERYSSMVTTRRRVKSLLYVTMISHVGFVAFTLLGKFLASDSSKDGFMDANATSMCVLSFLGFFLGANAVRASQSKTNKWATVKACALAAASLGGLQGAKGTYARVFESNSGVNGAAWIWSEGVTFLYKKFLGWNVAPGQMYPLCVNVEVLVEVLLVLLPLGVYGMCLGIESLSRKKNK